jgi:predicted transcriptional regulator
MKSPSPIEILNTELRKDPPVDLDKVAFRLGLGVRYREDLPDNVAGAILPEAREISPSGYTILINAKDNPRKRRFTLAYEIAHYVLHGDLISGGVTDDANYHSALGETYELEAKRLAADILMPAPLVKSLYAPHGDVGELGQKFSVSGDAMALRLKDLGLV